MTRQQEGLPLVMRRHAYADKRTKIEAGDTSPILYPGDFIQYWLEKNHTDPYVFFPKMGLDSAYLNGIFNTMYNDGAMSLPTALISNLAKISHRDEAFWRQREFHAQDAEHLPIDFDALNSHASRAQARKSAAANSPSH